MSGWPSGSFWDHFEFHFGAILDHLELVLGVFSKFFGDFSDLFEGCSDVCRFQWPALFS